MHLEHGRPEDDMVPMGRQFINLQARAGQVCAEKTHVWLSSHPSVERRVEIIGDVLSLLNRAAGCWWRCSESGHLLEGLSTANVSAGLAVLNLAGTGFYDQAISELRAIAERVNLAVLLLADEKEYRKFVTTPEDKIWDKFRPGGVRRRIELLGKQAPYTEADYSNFSLRVHPGSRTQHFSTERTNGYHNPTFQPLGFQVCIDQLAIASLLATTFGINLLGHLDNELRLEIYPFLESAKVELQAFDDMMSLADVWSSIGRVPRQPDSNVRSTHFDASARAGGDT